MKLLKPILLLAIFCPIVSFAQSNYKPGYIVTIKGDTLKGFIDYREWDLNPKSINFKQTGTTSAKTVTPADVSYLSINDLESFQKYAGNISRDETMVDRVIGGRDTSFITGDFFLRVMQRGRVIDLFSYTDGIKPRYFYRAPEDNVIHELVYRIYTNGNKTVTENTYIQQLTTIALKANVMDDKLQNMMDHADYNALELQRLVSKMNGLSNKDLKIKTVDNNKDVDVYVGAALNATTTKPYGQYQSAGGKTYTSYLPKVLFGINAYANPNTRKLVFSLEAGVSMAKYISNYINVRPPNTPISYTFNQILVSLRPQIKYNFYNTDNFKVYAGLGYDLGTAFYSNEKFIRQADGADASTGFLPLNFNKMSGAAVYKAGVQIKRKIEIYGTYLANGDLSVDKYFDLRQKMVQVGINYTLGQ
ncbi:hypothetical protein [Mucilaginibacter sp.]|uniref:hypothetical protein n=1 Tax=Mucilaginibacter sp. TaxID=1882438 RepID=UPI0035BBF320